MKHLSAVRNSMAMGGDRQFPKQLKWMSAFCFVIGERGLVILLFQVSQDSELLEEKHPAVTLRLGIIIRCA